MKTTKTELEAIARKQFENAGFTGEENALHLYTSGFMFAHSQLAEENKMLLEVCKKMIDCMENNHGMMPVILRDERKLMKQAIAKAEGRGE